ncbi:DedA family protein [Candidatus Ichthyocystis hellenicum]|uniref:DedA family protein n=1 Tax=Candidatus Ichthyocystis hellenicum TaxID=1561003 RepID=UPI0015846328|nr:VTT domain-containing protein [Candidatus Ichthyocystis hellenicum]
MLQLASLLNAESLLSWLLSEHPNSVYLAIFTIFFLESGVFFMPFLPGDSLLIIAGAVLSRGALRAHFLLASAVLGASIGNIFGYGLGFFLRKWRGFDNTLSLFDDAWVRRVQNFFAHYGGFSVILVRFMPFFRTFFPFIAGVFHSNFYLFSVLSFFGSVLWVSFFVYLGTVLGHWTFIQEWLGVFAALVVVASLLSFFLWVCRRSKR